ncbi:hypothetical protein ACLI4U_02115 [Natrialbaceae archaeon A-CW2]|uniref:hypothetical protein n=1 Tax=Natronosalvus amylolyticus TaxID=2961994 RepID=UPI0020CA10E2|nr:hypothetical protein [Natronosalvus amylolyticus]
MSKGTREKLTTVFTLRQWARLWIGSLVSLVGLALLYVRSIDFLGSDLLLPLSLGVLGVWCVWPVIIREAFGPMSASDAERIYQDVIDDADE